MTRQFLALSLGLGAMLLAAQQVSAQTQRNCGPHDAVVARLAQAYGETRRSIALAANNTVVEVFASQSSGSWTITMTAPGGPTCLVASGQAYEQVDESLPNTDPGA